MPYRLVRPAARRGVTPFDPGSTGSNSAFHALLESAPDSMILTNPTGTMVSVNSQIETVFGYPREELLGQPIDMLVPRSLRSRRPGCVYGRRKTGEHFPVEISRCSLETEQEILVIHSIRDVTERTRVERALAHVALEMMRPSGSAC